MTAALLVIGLVIAIEGFVACRSLLRIDRMYAQVHAKRPSGPRGFPKPQSAASAAPSELAK